MSTAVQTTLQLSLNWHDWLDLLSHYLMLSLLSVGGAISTLPDMHRYLVIERNWLTEVQFNSSVAIAQAAPGPNVLFVALMGWNVGLNAGSIWAGLLGVLVTMGGILLPSATLTYVTARWGHQNRHLRSVRSFKLGMGPVVIGLLLATGWIMAGANHMPGRDWPVWLLTAVSALIVWQTRLHLLWLLAAGAALGWFGLL